MVGAFLFYYAPQLFSVKHVEHMAAVGYLHGRSSGIFVACNHFNAIALQFYCHFLAQFSTAEQEGFLPF